MSTFQLLTAFAFGLLLSQASGVLSDRFGLWAAFASQAALCAGGLGLIELWANAVDPRSLERRAKAE